MSALETLRAAIDALPEQCVWHGAETAPRIPRREACCDTGVPAQRRKLALAALDEYRAEVLDEIDGELTARGRARYAEIRAEILRDVEARIRAMAAEHPTNAAWVQDCDHIASRVALAAAHDCGGDEQHGDYREGASP